MRADRGLGLFLALSMAVVSHAWQATSTGAGKKDVVSGPPSATSPAQSSGGSKSKPKASPKKITAKKATHSGDKDTAQGSGADYIQDVVSLPRPLSGFAAPDADEIIALLKNPAPFTMASQGSSVIVIYSSKPQVRGKDREILHSLYQGIRRLAANQKRVAEISVPHAGALGDLVARVTALKYKDITVEGVGSAGSDRIRITRDVGVTDTTYNEFLRDLLHLAWQPKPESPIGRVFYIQASAAAGALGGSSASSGQKAGAEKPTGDSGAPKESGKVLAGGKAEGTAKNDGGSGSASSDQSSDVAHDSDTQGTSTKNASASQDKSAVSVTPVNDDLLVFSSAQRGDDAEISERKRILAAIDFPRPEVIINALTFQTSSSDPRAVQRQVDELKLQIGSFNNALQAGIGRAWSYLQRPDLEVYFDSDFFHYLTQRFVADSPLPSDPAFPSNPIFLSNTTRSAYGICDPSKYCLGYSHLFRPIKPSLTEMLLAVIAASDPAREIRAATKAMENIVEQAPTIDRHGHLLRCDQRDEIAVGYERNRSASSVPMYCFEEEINTEFPQGNIHSRAKPLRAAIANFLFNYKLSQQYPHEFSPYELSQSAQELNAELNPLIVAFNQDIVAFLDVISRRFPSNSKRGWFGFAGHGSTFVNNGVITVRTISGQQTTVDAVTQTYFDATNPPSVTDVINSIGTQEKNIPGVLKTNLTANEAATIIGALNSVTTQESHVGREFKIDIKPRSLSGASSSELDITMETMDSAEPTLYTNGKSGNPDELSRVGKHNIQTKVRLESVKLFEISSFSAMLQRSRKNFPLLPPFVEIPYIGSFVSVPLPGAKEFHQSTAVLSAIVVPTAADLANGLPFTFDRVAIASNNAYGSSRICSSVPDGTNHVDCTSRAAISLKDLGGFSIRNYNKAKVSCFGSEAGSPYPSSNGLPCAALDMRTMPQDAP